MRTSGCDGNNWPGDGLGNGREGNRQQDVKHSEREQKNLRRDGRRWEQKPQGREWSGFAVGNKMSYGFPFPSRPHFPATTFTARAPGILRHIFVSADNMFFSPVVSRVVRLVKPLCLCQPSLTHDSLILETAFSPKRATTSQQWLGCARFGLCQENRCL